VGEWDPKLRASAHAKLTFVALPWTPIDFFVYSRAVSNAADGGDAHALTEEHWSYMDQFADRMIARGPTLATDRETWTGSLHILDLPSADAVHEFVEREPYNRAGLFEHHLIRRFNNLLGRTMWESPGGSDDPRFLVIAHTLPGLTALAPERLNVHGELLALDDATPVGVALALQAPTREAVDTLLRGGQAIDVHDWEFGGRR
jgi:uncharacterized protein